MANVQGSDHGRRRPVLRPSALVPNVLSGVVIGVLCVVLSISFSALVFGGRFAARLPDGIGMTLLAAALMLTVTALTSGLPQMTSIPQDITAALLAVVGTGIAQAMRGRPEAAFLTLVGAIVVTALVAALLFGILGTFRLGDLVRFAPYPVIGGFLAGTGWLLLKGGAGVVTGVPLALGSVGEYLEGVVLLRWVAGALFATVLLVLMRRFGKPLLIPGTIAVGIGLFYAG